jgi:hypothetical protein
MQATVSHVVLRKLASTFERSELFLSLIIMTITRLVLVPSE